jgi:hypothetical protein
MAFLKPVFASIVSICAAANLSIAVAQTPGSRVRVTIDSLEREPIVGTLVSLTDDSIALRVDLLLRDTTLPYYTTSFSRSKVRRLEMKTGQHGHALVGLSAGFVVGAVGGGVIASATYSSCRTQRQVNCFMSPSRDQQTILGVLAGGALGMVVGTIFGALSITEEWSLAPGYHGGGTPRFETTNVAHSQYPGIPGGGPARPRMR